MGEQTQIGAFGSDEADEANEAEKTSVDEEDLSDVEIEGARDESGDVGDARRAAEWDINEGVISYEGEATEARRAAEWEIDKGEAGEVETGFNMTAYKQELNEIVDPVLPDDRMEKLEV